MKKIIIKLKDKKPLKSRSDWNNPDDWSGINPFTRVVPGKAKYIRNPKHKKDLKDDPTI